MTCWSEIQKQELIGGADWPPERVNVGGMPPYDGYVRKTWLTPRDEYFSLHGLDPQRRLLSYASSFVSWSPNLQNVEALADLVAHDRLVAPSQLLVRLHPIHMSGHYVAEADRIRQMARELPHIHVVEPVPLGALGHYSGEDVVERTSMMAHSDIFLTVYSTMCVEASFQERPIVSVCIDSTARLPRQILGAHVADRRLAHPLALPHLGSRQGGAGRGRAASRPSMLTWKTRRPTWKPSAAS